MKELVLVSGKGGTGKTSVTAAFTVAAEERVVIADCDVDAPDLHYLLQPEVLEEHPFTASKQAFLDPEACIQCGLCAEMCRFGAIGRDLVVDELACEGCGLCSLICPEKAVHMDDVVSGYWFNSKTQWGPMIHARLNYAEGNSGKLVSEVKEQARKTARDQDADLVLVDGPPGTGCPVIASLAGASQVLAMAEASVAGLHDLKRIYRMCSHFEIPTAVCINQWDLAENQADQIESFCAEESIPVLGRIPHDPEVTAAMLRGETVMHGARSSPAAESIARLWHALRRMLQENAKPHKRQQRA